MKRAIFIVVGLIAFALIVTVTVPSFINWNNYKSEISSQVHKLTGRDLVIAGDISVKIFPAPRLVADNVSLSSLDGAANPDLVSLNSVEVQIALAPLITGQVRVETVRLVEPRIYLEVLADGRSTWEITPPISETAAQDPEKAEGVVAVPANGGAPAVIIDAFEIVGGNVIYEDPASGVSETVADINMEIAAASLTEGPYSLEGGLLARGLRLSVDADVGTIVEGRTFPVDASFGIGGDRAKIKINGTVIGLDAAPRFTGSLAVTADDIAALAKAFSPDMDFPKPLSQRFALSGNIDASSVDLTFTDFDINIGGSMGKGSVKGQFAEIPRITAEVQIDKVAVDPWLENSGAAPKANNTNDGGQSAPSAKGSSPSANASPAENTEGSFALPDGIDVSANIRVGEVSMRGDAVENVVLSAQLAKGEVTLSQFTLQGPGKLDVAAFGFITAKDGAPSFDSSIEASVEDLESLLKWVDVKTGLPAGKPGNLRLKAAAKGTDKNISLQQLSLSFDETNIVGAANIALRDRLGIGATIKVDKINVDSYLPLALAPAPARPAQPAPANTPSDSPATPQSTGGYFSALAHLAEIDANINVSVQSLTAAGVLMKDIKADVGLLTGNMTIRNVSVGDAAGVSSVLTGALNNLGGVPVAKALKTDVKINDPAMLAKIAGVDLPVSVKDLGDVSFTATVDGGLEKPGISSSLKAMAATINATGTISPFELGSLFDLAVNMQHADMVSLLRRLGVAYTPSGDIGAVSVSSRLKGGITGLTFSDLLAKVGNANVSGDGNVRLLGARPKLTATLQTNEIVVDPFLPAKKAASLSPFNETPKIIPAGFQVPLQGSNGLFQLIANVHPRWSPAPIDLAGLGIIDADVTLTSPQITYNNYRLDNANVIAELKDKVLTVKDFTGSVFTGAFQSSAIVNAAGAQPQISGLITLGNMDIGQATKAAGGPDASGKLTTRLEVATLGNSVADYVSLLNGKGAIQVNGIKGDAAISNMPVIGLALGPLLRIFELLNSGLGVLAKTGLGDTNVTSTFVIENGIIKTNDTRMLSNIYDGNISGVINLPQWTMDVGGKVALDQGVIGGILANVVRIPSDIPFNVSGNIDKPNVKLQSIGSAEGGGIKIPGLEKLDKKVPGVGGLIQGILGGGSSGSSGTTAPPSQGSGTEPPAQQPPAQEAPANPAERLIRGLLGG